MIELRITKTCMFATTGRNAGWQRYDDARKTFADIAAANAWLREEYGSARRRAMYRDTADGKTIRCGFIACFRPKFRSKGEPIAEQHWIEYRNNTPVNLDERRK